MPTKKQGTSTPQNSYEHRMRQQGFTKVGVWVPVEDRDEILEIGAEMRNEFLESQDKNEEKNNVT